MKINLTITLDNDARRVIASHTDGKQTQRLATRAEVRALVTALVQRHCEQQWRDHEVTLDDLRASFNGGGLEAWERASTLLRRQSV